MTLPNMLTMSRIVLIPVFVLAFYLPNESHRMVATGVFFLAGFTDWLDGYIARKMNQTTRFGAFLDPVADKLMVAVALTMIVEAELTITNSSEGTIKTGKSIVFVTPCKVTSAAMVVLFGSPDNIDGSTFPEIFTSGKVIDSK